MGKSSPIQESTSRETRATRTTTDKRGVMTTQAKTDNRDRRTRGADTLKASRYFETAAPAPKQTGDREKRDGMRQKKKRRTSPKPPASPIGPGKSSARERPTTPTVRTRSSSPSSGARPPASGSSGRDICWTTPRPGRSTGSGKSGGDVSAGRASSGPVPSWSQTAAT